MTRKLGVALAATIVLLAGCGGGGGGRPSVDELSNVFVDGGEFAGEDFNFPKEQADCIAKLFHESDLSDEALNAIVEKDEDFEPSDKDEEVAAGFATNEDFAACVTPSS